jgi:TonB-dependent starch-binding outer membrane protein SusC
MTVSLMPELRRTSGLPRLLLTKFKSVTIFVCLLVFFMRGHAQNNVHIKGHLSNTSGLPVSNASVIVKGSAAGVNSDENGNFEIDAPSNSTLLISSVGYATTSVKVGGNTSLRIVLSISTSSLDQVIVVGYGTQRKRDVTGAVVSVNEQALRETPSANVTDALIGKAAGVEIQTTSTHPGAVGQIRIRGARSLTATNDPLIVVDGIPYVGGNLNDINPNDIKSVDVLKDASATAIYGSRGANGVILITTQRGRLGDARVSYNGYQGVNTVQREYPLFNASEFQALRSITGYTYTPPEQEYLAQGKSTDWQKLMYENGNIGDHQIDVSGGTDKTQYSLGGGYHDEHAVLPGMRFQRYALRMTLDQKIGKYVRVGMNSLNSVSITNGENSANMYPILSLTPFDPAHDSTGALVYNPAYPTENEANPLLAKDQSTWVERRKRISTFNSLYGEVQILPGLKYRLNLGLSYFSDQYGNFYGANSAFITPGSVSTAAVSNTQGYSYTIENLLNYNKTFGKKHHVDFTGLYSFEEDEMDNDNVAAADVVANYLQYYNLGLSNQPITVNPANQSYSQRDLISYMGRINYNYDDRYLLTVTGRIDGSSVLAPGNKYHDYAALSAGWNITNENFMKKSDWLNNLKLRVGFGQTSNQGVNPYSTQGSLSQNLYNFGTPTTAYGYYVSTLPNPNLGWEYTQTVNIGVDFGILSNRITGSIDVYKQQTKGLLLNQSLPATSGVPGSFLTNVGQTQNQGVEVSLTTVLIQSPHSDGFTWSVDWNFYLNRNKIVSLQSGVSQDIGNGWFVGQPIDVIYDYKKLGIWQQQDSVLAASYGERVGQIRVADLNKDNKISGADQTVLGSFQPKFEGGITTRFNFKGFDLSVVMYGKDGGMLQSLVHQPSAYLNSLNGRRNQIKVNYWTPTNPTNDYPYPTIKDGDNPLYGSTLGYFDASYLKIQSINFGYTFSQKWVSKIAAKSLRFYVSSNNVAYLFSPYIKAGGVSPEPTGYGIQGGVAGGAGNVLARQLTIGANTPPVRSFLIGLNIRY